jgi:hypothetical protein
LFFLVKLINKLENEYNKFVKKKLKKIIKFLLKNFFKITSVKNLGLSKVNEFMFFLLKIWVGQRSSQNIPKTNNLKKL